MATRMHLTWKWTLTDSSFSSSESFRSSYYSSRQYNDNTHVQTHVTHKASCLSLTASFITAVSEEWLLPPEGWGRPSGWATGASEMSRVGGKNEFSLLSVTCCKCCTHRAGEPQHGLVRMGAFIYVKRTLVWVICKQKYTTRCHATQK